MCSQLNGMEINVLLTYNRCEVCTCDLQHCIDTIRLVDPHWLSYTFELLRIHPHRFVSVYVVSLNYCQLMSVHGAFGVYLRVTALECRNARTISDSGWVRNRHQRERQQEIR